MVKIIETPDGLELRSTSWYEIDREMRHYTSVPIGNPRRDPEYEFIEDHIEIEGFKEEFGAAIPETFVFNYVVILKKLAKTA